MNRIFNCLGLGLGLFFIFTSFFYGEIEEELGDWKETGGLGT